MREYDDDDDDDDDNNNNNNKKKKKKNKSERLSSITIGRQTIYSSQSLWRIYVSSALRLWSSWESLDVGWVASVEKSERPAFFPAPVCCNTTF